MSNLKHEIGQEQLSVTQRTKIKRMPSRGHYERELVYQILDEGLVCHIGFTVDEQPFVIPTAYGQVGDRLGSARLTADPPNSLGWIAKNKSAQKCGKIDLNHASSAKTLLVVCPSIGGTYG